MADPVAKVQPSTKPKRRWLRYSLRTMLVAVTAFCVWLGWFVGSARRQMHAVQVIQSGGGVVRYDFQLVRDSLEFGDYDGHRRPMPLAAIIGQDYFANAVRVALWNNASDSTMEQVGNLCRLRHLRMSNTIISDDGLAYLKHLNGLKAVRLSSSKITDAGLAHLADLTELELLTIDGDNRKISDAGLKHLRGLTSLRTLNLVQSEITDAGLEFVKGMTRLQTLSIGGDEMTDAGLEVLQACDRLESLSLHGTHLTDAGMHHLQRLSRLKSLSLVGTTHITDAGIQQLASLSKLEFLSVSGTKVTEAGARKLNAVQSHVMINGNSFSVTSRRTPGSRSTPVDNE